ncbi:NAD/NADP-dependent betaine aldehyde dehydrogenase [Vibrio aerogenes CECT 7868]|uniref:NAD/NADP-dependent betaine aldehyde dehydrogenase n=1 Tax=Vibrio aerogenes CECT 7868 TaxID=1216006 RepID=A0A1M6D5T1_9VIBR|nr:aldehyde dehydrogenase family protein [Vibrio aerogenes]SHI68589.1 NAD/NADP-dependent betaine aldehyde dehydrogenase [Vibrio aerogenes CECT 7868]
MDWYNPSDTDIPKGHFIDGRFMSFNDDTSVDVICPSTGQAYAALNYASPDTVEFAVSQAYQAYRTNSWASMAPRERAKYLFQWAELIEKHQASLAQLESLGSSRPYHEVLQWDIPYVVDCLRFFAELADKHGGYVGATQQDRLGMVISQPYGVIGAITPWNFPMSMLMWKVGPALAAGNAVVLKPSEMTPFTSVYLAKLAVDAGIPANQFNVVQGDGKTVGQAICEHSLIGKVTFTGSTATGAAIMSTCALKGPKPSTLELGGKSPQVVFADADIDKTALTVAKAITGNAGQVCVSGSRLIIHQDIAETFSQKVLSHFSQLRMGPTWNKSTTLPPIISAGQAQRINSIVNQSIAQGAERLCGGELINDGGSFFTPTLLAITDNNNCAVQQEIFGPVLTMQTFDSDEQAWALASHETYGLAAGIHTQNLQRALTGMRQIEAGSVWINRYGRSFDHIMPTGGFKQSGIGKDIGVEAFQANLKTKSVLIDF